MLSNAKFIGCDVCSILSEGILKFLSDNSCGLARGDAEELRIDFNLAGSRRSLEVVLLQTPIKLSFFASQATPWLTETLPDLPVGNQVPSTTSSEESLTWATQQVQTCRQSHKACNSFSTAPLPSRVLDVSANGESGVRLYVSQGETDPYIALSHCWGHRPFLRTLSGSLDAHRSEIVWSQLPQTFQDAIQFTRRLGIRYLWIDSLCIIQDDEHDWRREAAKMASVYQNAALVISAAKSNGAYGGLYAEMPDKHRTYTVRFSGNRSDEDGDSTSSSQETTSPQEDEQDQPEIHLRVSLTHAHRLLSPYHAPTSALPIFTRGWILQERFLSPRILHFGAEEISFECLESSTCQCTAPPAPPTPASALTHETQHAPDWYKHLLDRTARPKHYYALPTWLNQTPTRMTPRDLQTAWRRLVEDYTHLRLSHDRDIFPAIAGMAQQMQLARRHHHAAAVQSPPRYVAGLWEDTLLRGDLLWHVELPPQEPATSEVVAAAAAPAAAAAAGGKDGRDDAAKWEGGWVCRPRQGWRAPSWSWASVRAPVGFLGNEEGIQPEGEVVEVKCEVVDSQDPSLTGELRAGGSWLVLKGRLIPALLRFKAPKDGEGMQPWNVVDLDIMDGGHLKNLWVDDDCRWLVTDEGEQPRVYCLVVGRKLPRKELLCLVLTRVPQEERKKLAARDEGGPQDDGHLYRRIGMLEVFGGPATPVLWGWLHNLLGKGEDAVVRIV